MYTWNKTFWHGTKRSCLKRNVLACRIPPLGFLNNSEERLCSVVLGKNYCTYTRQPAITVGTATFGLPIRRYLVRYTLLNRATLSPPKLYLLYLRISFDNTGIASYLRNNHFHFAFVSPSRACREFTIILLYPASPLPCIHLLGTVPVPYRFRVHDRLIRIWLRIQWLLLKILNPVPGKQKWSKNQKKVLNC